jgi:hypothetical protein
VAGEFNELGFPSIPSDPRVVTIDAATGNVIAGV